MKDTVNKSVNEYEKKIRGKQITIKRKKERKKERNR